MSKKITEDIVETIKNGFIEKEKNKTISTGSTLLDLVLGGGLAVGKIINIVGDKSSGKTLLALECIANAKRVLKDKLKIFYDDCESGFSFDEQELYGIKIIDDEQKNSETIEELMYNLNKKLDELEEDEFLIYVVDSLDGLSSEAEKERMEEEIKARDKGKVISKGTYGMEKQKKLSEIFRLLSHKIKEKNCILVIISQVRSNIGVMFGEKYVRTGGKALDFYASQIIWLSEVEKIKKKDYAVGIRTKVKCKKNKIGIPFRECFLDILFDYGVDNINSNINYLYDLLSASGKYSAKKIEWEDKEFTPVGLIKYIEENNLEEILDKRVKDRWIETEKSISNETRKRKF